MHGGGGGGAVVAIIFEWFCLWFAEEVVEVVKHNLTTSTTSILFNYKVKRIARQWPRAKLETCGTWGICSMGPQVFKVGTQGWRAWGQKGEGHMGKKHTLKSHQVLMPFWFRLFLWFRAFHVRIFVSHLKPLGGLPHLSLRECILMFCAMPYRFSIFCRGRCLGKQQTKTKNKKQNWGGCAQYY